MGGLYKGVKGYQAARAEGGSTGEAVGAGLTGALSGASTGAAVGGLAGGLSGAMGSALSPEKAEKLRAALTQRSSLARFGQRQVHGLTGAINSDGLRGLRMDSEQRAEALRSLKDKAKSTGLYQGSDLQAIQRHGSEVSDATKSLAAARKAESMGLTSLPGIAHSMVHNGVGETVRGALGHQLHGTSTGNKLLAGGLTGMGVVSAAQGQEGDTGHDRAKRVGKAVAATGLGVMTGGLPIIPGMLAGSIVPNG